MENMKLNKSLLRAVWLIVVLFVFINTNAQNAQQARKILDKTVSIVSGKGGASANFSISSSKIGKASGTIVIKGNKFYTRTPQATIWYDGKTQWSYLKRTNEVNVSIPNHSQQVSMNPYTFINLYRSGYQLSSKMIGNNYQVHMIAQNKRNSINEVYILIYKRSYIPKQVKLKQGNQWTTINISNFKNKNLPNSIFVFCKKDIPSAEVIDLR